MVSVLKGLLEELVHSVPTEHHPEHRSQERFSYRVCEALPL